MTDTLMLHLDPQAWLASRYAVKTVTCPRCEARPGQECQSTGGGNGGPVSTHAVRFERIAAWSPGQMFAASDLVKAQGRTWWAHLPVGYYAATEAAAAPIVVKTRTATPKGVRLSEAQAERIEWAAQSEGRYDVSTAHFHGDAADRQSVNALEEKGILRFVETIDHGYSRRLELTAFGWQVYRQHRLVIRNLPDEVAADLEAKAAAAEARQLVGAS